MPAQNLANEGASTADGRIRDAVARMWGFDALRPLQRDAIRAGVEGRDSLVVLPTGGGKSLCYQVPPLVAGRTDVVVSPLISLMKDQVDGLRACGYPATAVHSNLTDAERTAAFDGLREGRFRLVFVSPERLAMPSFVASLERARVSAFAVDEAHCISHWGHDFRPEYRQIASLRARFPNASLHAFTATATPRVRTDIAEQLSLRDPRILVGNFDRPNLTYRVLPRVDLFAQVSSAIQRHQREAVIIYCLSRRDTEQLADRLRANGTNAAAYHAGLARDERRHTQEAFAEEKLDVVVATVAFGMGIDRSDVRCVIHAAMPKSIEHYQQETGRAGRDGLAAECVLFYSAADVVRWRGLIERDASSDGGAATDASAQVELLRHIQGLCSTLQCRHRALSRYFGQDYDSADCGACDVCLREIHGMANATVTAQKILSCVARVEQRYGIGHVVSVLRGTLSEPVRRVGHEQLSTFGLLSDISQKALTNLTYQLVDQGLLDRTPGDRPVLKLNGEARAVLRGDREVQLIEPVVGVTRRSKADDAGWEAVDRDLFEQLREVRRTLATERSVPAYVIFGDRTLREMARLQPTHLDALRAVHGVGDKKLADLGPRFIEEIRRFRGEQGEEEVVVVRDS